MLIAHGHLEIYFTNLPILYNFEKYGKIMTTEEFKIEYPQYSHLENDALWDKMTEVLLQSDNVLIADPNREIIYHDPIVINGMSYSVEDDSTTVWLNNKGEKVKLKEPEYFKGSPTESYKCEIIDFGEL